MVEVEGRGGSVWPEDEEVAVAMIEPAAEVETTEEMVDLDDDDRVLIWSSLMALRCAAQVNRSSSPSLSDSELKQRGHKFNWVNISNYNFM